MKVKRVLLLIALFGALAIGLGVVWVTNPIVGRSYRPGAGADPERLEGDVRALTGLEGFRCFERPVDLERAADWAKNALEATGLPVQEQPFSVGDLTFRNLVAHYGPDEGPVLVVGAHYDVCGEQPGADDNASAVAGLLELARLLVRHQPEVPYRLELVLWPLEEPPNFRTERMGSAVHAERLADRGADVHGMISLEMIGFFTDEEGSQGSPAPGLQLLYPSRGDFIAVVGNSSSWWFTRRIKARMLASAELPVRSINAPASVPGVDFSDHLNFWKHGWHAVMITDTAFFRNPNYHQTTDTPDTLDYERMADVVTGVYAAVTNP
ncbi:MAG: M28 family peptidase [Acidobacteriota bacterium]